MATENRYILYVSCIHTFLFQLQVPRRLWMIQQALSMLKANIPEDVSAKLNLKATQTPYYNFNVYSHCGGIPKSCFRCKCKDNSLFCNNCKGKACKSCESSQYKRDKTTDGKIRKLKVYCGDCKVLSTLSDLLNNIHVCSTIEKVRK